MRNVLLIGHYWPYRNGSIRTSCLVDYLPDFGWNPVIVTGKIDNYTKSKENIYEIDYSIFLEKSIKLFIKNKNSDAFKEFKEKIISRNKAALPFLRSFHNKLSEVCAYPDEHKGWKTPCLKSCRELIVSKKIDAVISIWPVTSHLVAQELKKKFGLLWIADYPDLWSQNANYSFGKLRHKKDERLEKKVISTADYITTISNPFTDKLKQIHMGKEVVTIPHGFNPKYVNTSGGVPNDLFVISYTGLIYRGKQDISKFLIGLKELIDEKKIDSKKVRVHFYGPFYEWLETEINNLSLSGIVKQKGFIQKEECIKKQHESVLLLLLNWEDESEKGVIPSKILEYFAARRPILATGGFGNDTVDKMIAITKSGRYLKTVSDIKAGLEEYYNKYLDKSLTFSGDLNEIDKFSMIETARKFSELLDHA
jgi:glycosyltransferase involved in cell wall biosynthesis